MVFVSFCLFFSLSYVLAYVLARLVNIRMRGEFSKSFLRKSVVWDCIRSDTRLVLVFSC